MADWLQDLKYALRRLSKSPGLAAAVVVSIGLGIAANATIFSMVSRFILRPPPVGEPSTLMAVYITERGECCNQFSWSLFADLREQAKSFSGVAGYYELVPASVGGTGDPERVWGQAVTSNFFDVSRLGMTLGRGFIGGEEQLPVVVLGYRLWQRRFGGDRSIAGKSITLSGQPFTVVGVAPPAFMSLDQILDTQFWVPLGNLDQLLPNTSKYDSRLYHWLAVVGRLKPGATRSEAQAELDVLARLHAKAYPAAEKDLGFRLEPDGSVPPREKPLLMFFLAALTAVALLVLAIACGNVANLLLAQASGRRQEMAVRLALGATRGQLMRQMFTECVLLAVGGGLTGVALSWWATRALSTLPIPAPVPLDLALSVDWRVVLYATILSLGTGLFFGMAPAWNASRPILASTLQGEDMLARPGSRFTLGNLLVVSQIAMSMVLLCATGLFLRSLSSASHMDIGFRPGGVLMMSVDPRLNGYTAERTTQFLTQLRQRAAALPGVTSVAWTDVAPLSGGNRSDAFSVEGRPATGHSPGVDLYMATPGYFDTLGIPWVAGRDFGNESPTAPKVAVINEAFAHRLFPNQDPIGQRVKGGGVTYQIIGVVKNTKSRTLGEDLRLVLYRSLDQSIGGDPSFLGYSLLLRSESDPAMLAPAMRREISALDPTMAVFNVQTMQEHLRAALFLPRLAGTLFGVFGLVGLLLATVGLYGVMSYSVSRRTREMGIRLALGARSSAVERLVVYQGMVLTLIAVALGLAVAWAVARSLTAILYGVRPHDLVTFTAVPLFLAAVALLACWIPARRASRVDPLAALRYE